MQNVWRQTLQLEVVQQLPIERGRPVLKQLKTASSARIVAFGRTTAKVLLAHRKRQEEEAEFAGPAWKDSGLVITTALGGQVDPNNLQRPANPRDLLSAFGPSRQLVLAAVAVVAGVLVAQRRDAFEVRSQL